ncbi:MAG: tRNA (N(6)-L-threonylcarbamoyladenosine(37)-C(2))-methylthiotransferase MtaB, partial [Bosea sp. (in: a-proteobacteria)]|nr:tRNA (N(6)-L-threonylcarbamoyladenosine(37)-C(2))-methylthiotransferase MtaB [Bosea sp. (in: a-proteobacteria)]
GTPAARMPQLPGPVVAERAARLRESAEEAHAAHLAARLGRPLTVLTERGNTGRAPDFTLVRFRRDTAPGEILSVSAETSDGRALIAA